jgi:hypothetical protein
MANELPADAAFLRKMLRDEMERFEKRNLAKTGGGGDITGMDPWQQTVETRLSELRGDVRHLDLKVDRNFLVTWGGIIAVALGIAAIIARVYGIL